MRYVANNDGLPTLELSERNLRTLLNKLTSDRSQRTLIDPDRKIAVTAVPDSDHYAERPAGRTMVMIPEPSAEVVASMIEHLTAAGWTINPTDVASLTSAFLRLAAEPADDGYPASLDRPTEHKWSV